MDNQDYLSCSGLTATPAGVAAACSGAGEGGADDVAGDGSSREPDREQSAGLPLDTAPADPAHALFYRELRRTGWASPRTPLRDWILHELDRLMARYCPRQRADSSRLRRVQQAELHVRVEVYLGYHRLRHRLAPFELSTWQQVVKRGFTANEDLTDEARRKTVYARIRPGVEAIFPTCRHPSLTWEGQPRELYLRRYAAQVRCFKAHWAIEPVLALLASDVPCRMGGRDPLESITFSYGPRDPGDWKRFLQQLKAKPEPLHPINQNEHQPEDEEPKRPRRPAPEWRREQLCRERQLEVLKRQRERELGPRLRLTPETIATHHDRYTDEWVKVRVDRWRAVEDLRLVQAFEASGAGESMVRYYQDAQDEAAHWEQQLAAGLLLIPAIDRADGPQPEAQGVEDLAGARTISSPRPIPDPGVVDQAANRLVCTVEAISAAKSSSSMDERQSCSPRPPGGHVSHGLTHGHHAVVANDQTGAVPTASGLQLRVHQANDGGR